MPKAQWLDYEQTVLIGRVPFLARQIGLEAVDWRPVTPFVRVSNSIQSKYGRTFVILSIDVCIITDSYRW